VKLLLHLCCSNCALYPLDRLRRRGDAVFGLWYNPNIHPVQEYRARLRSVEALREAWHFDLTVQDDYGLVNFVRAVAGHESERCAHCYEIRLDEAARTARAEGLDAFSTTLLISPYQQHDLIRATGNRMAEKHNVAFHYEDYRPGFPWTREKAVAMDLYRQKYCGCIYSEMERFWRREKQQKK